MKKKRVKRNASLKRDIDIYIPENYSIKLNALIALKDTTLIDWISELVMVKIDEEWPKYNIG